MTAPLSREWLRALPKAELHCHLDGSLRPATLLELAREYGKTVPGSTPEAVASAMLVRDARDLEQYLEKFAVTLSVMQRAEALERIAYELVIDSAAEGVRYLEMRYAPVLCTREGLTNQAAVEAPLRGIRRATRETGTTARVIICGLRHLEPRVSIELAELAVANRAEGVVGFDLAGGERGHPARDHAAAFAFAQRHDLAVTVHAGEGDGADSVRQAVHECGADRIGHGTRLVEDAALEQYVNDRRIALEICLTSNVQTHAAQSYAAHPLRGYFDRGMNVTLATDNRMMSGVTLTDEYAHAAEHLGFTARELGRLALNGFESAFLPYEERRRLIDAARRDLAAMGA
jgi:adenosine deaminase